MVGLLSGFDPRPPMAGMDLLTCGLVGQGRGLSHSPDSKILTEWKNRQKWINKMMHVCHMESLWSQNNYSIAL